MYRIESVITTLSYHFYRLILLCMGIAGIFGLLSGLGLSIYAIGHMSAVSLAKASLLFIASGLLSSGAWDILHRLPSKWTPVKGGLTISK